MCADLLHLGEQVQQMEQVSIDFLHLDVMDMHFVPNLTLGFDLINQLGTSSIPRDIHLMVEHVRESVDAIHLKPADVVSFHIEAPVNIADTIAYVKNKSRVGLAINPDTPLEKIYPYVSQLDMVILMSVTPGHAGQPFDQRVYDKATTLIHWLSEQKLTPLVSVDGGIGPEQIRKFATIGANVFVLGTKSLFKGDFGESLRTVVKLREEIVSSI